ncbi:hypothetical protein DES36_10459 [Alkalibaculum bacchi]|uniref:Uncharacterized protein n=1 Tax=Alkalibaculum bacchi TaxID=645887 RepID=A0A366IAT7_9FIRM|nr:hypothetical protein [Alkalibaculum bacchi]RBP67360.1 hypothetical protein DES36_10459 [Alkalibaculum bacchi]
MLTKKIILLMTILALSLSLVTVDNIVEAKEPIVSEKIGKDLTIEILKGGRVAPIKNKDIQEEHLDLILQKIGYPNESVKRWNVEKKRQLASYGGKVVDTQLSEFKHEYVSKDGKAYEVTSSNKDEIRKKQLDDLKQLGVRTDEQDKYNIIKENESLLSTTQSNGENQDGKWSAMIIVADIGETTKQYKYVVLMDYYWDGTPNVSFGDNAGLSWEPFGQPVANTAIGVHSWEYLGAILTSYHDLNLSSNSGVTSSFWYHTNTEIPYHIGYLLEEINVSKNYTGEQLTISAAYTHPWVPNDWSISVGEGGLSLGGSIGFGDKWTWRHNFTPTPL